MNKFTRVCKACAGPIALLAFMVAGFAPTARQIAVAQSPEPSQPALDASLFPEPIAVTVSSADPAPINPATADVSTQSATGAPTPTSVEAVVILVNQLRATKGLAPLKYDATLTKASGDYATKLGSSNFFGHNDPDAGCNKPSDRLVAAGYTNWHMVGENIAAGYASPQDVFNAWSQSAGHLANMLNDTYREIGVGYYYDASDGGNVRQGGNCPYASTGGPYRYYWSQEFGGRYINGQPYLPVVINGEAVSTVQRSVNLYIYGGITGQAIWAKQMRFSNDGTNWTSWEPWTATRQYTLPDGAGLKTVYVQLSNGSATQTVNDTIYLDATTPFSTNLPARAFIPIVVR